jgi:hypothetical protein
VARTVGQTTALTSARRARARRAASKTASAEPAPPERAVAPHDAADPDQLALTEDSAPSAILIRGATHPPHPAVHIVPRRSGPRSPVMQFCVGMVIMMALLATLGLATPLGRTAGLSSAFQAYAKALPWIPTPTPTLRPAAPAAFTPPHEADPGKQTVVNDIVAVFGPYAQGALAVAQCESGYDPNAWNPYPINGSHASGVFQILYPSTWDGTSYASDSPFNADANIHAAYQLFQRDGDTWREWQCQP